MIKTIIVEARITYIEKLNNDMISYMSVLINDKEVPLNNSFFYTHPHFGEQDIKCIIPLDSLGQGIHLVKIFKKSVEKGVAIKKDSLFLAFIKY